MRRKTGKLHEPSRQLPSDALPDAPPSFLLRHLYWAMPFGLFLVLRLFCGDPYCLLGGDQCTFLELGRTFPRHALFNHELYLIHSPLFGYAIGLLYLVLPLLAAGLVASLLFACINFFAVRSLARFDSLPQPAICAGLMFLALSRPGAAYDYHVARVSILACSTAIALLAFLRLLREPNRKTLSLAIAANAFSLLVSDQALLLLPCEVVILLVRGLSVRDIRLPWKSAGLLGATSAISALIWPVVRLMEFLQRSDLPAGISGSIEFTRNFPLLAVLQPNFLPFTNIHRSLFTQTSLSLWNLKPVLMTKLATDLLVLPRALSIALVLGLMLAALLQPARRRRAAQWLALSLLLLLPVGLGMNEWYGMAFVVPFSLLMMEGAAACISWRASTGTGPEKTVTLGLSAVCVLAAAIWLSAPAPEMHDFLSPRGGTQFLFTRPPLTRSADAVRFFASMPRDTGIMAPTDLSPEVVYLTDQRVLALPFDPALLDRFIAEYRISYVITSNEFLRRYAAPVADQYTSSLVNRFIVQHPERYRLVHVHPETYPAFFSPTEYYVFQVQNPVTPAER